MGRNYRSWGNNAASFDHELLKKLFCIAAGDMEPVCFQMIVGAVHVRSKAVYQSDFSGFCCELTSLI